MTDYSTSQYEAFTESDSHSTATIVSSEVMSEVYRDLDTPPMGTQKLGDLLKEIENESRY